MESVLVEKRKKGFIFMNKENTLVVIENNHPLYATISKNFATRSVEDALSSYETYELVIDLSPLRTKNKVLFLKELVRTTKAEVISDLSLTWPEMVLNNCPKISGAVSLLFFSPTEKVETFAKTPVAQKHIDDFLAVIGKGGVNHQDLKVGFHYPRAISMIINEAYFALEENLASPKDIDLAMKFGVNYPLGPIEWGDKIGLKYVVDLLNELYEITEDSRYRVSRELKIKGNYL